MEKKIRKTYITWSNSDRMALLTRRIELDKLFSSKNANSNDGWRKVAGSLQETLLDPSKDHTSCKNQWNSLIKKYKELSRIRTGEGTADELSVEDAEDWPFFEIIKTYAGRKDNFNPPFLLDSSQGVLRPQCESRSTTPSTTPRSESPHPSPRPSSSHRSHSRLDRLERLITKSEKRTRKQMSSLLSVFGQMVQSDYPHIDTTSLLIESSDSD